MAVDCYDPSIARLSPAEQDYYLEGMSTFRAVNAMALAAERAGRGFAYLWPPESAFALEPENELDEIVRLFR